MTETNCIASRFKMLNDSDSDSQNERENQDFVNLICMYPIVLEKSQLPATKDKKLRAFLSIQDLIFTKTGKRLEISALQKKVSNMKTRLRKKTDIKATGNKRIKLSDNETKLLDLLKSDTNPVFQKAFKKSTSTELYN